MPRHAAPWCAAGGGYRSGLHPAIALCVRRRGQVVLNRSIGHAAGNGPDDAEDAPKVLATPATPFCIFSAAKAVTAMVVHLLDQRRLIHLDDPVAEYLPEFAVHTKQWITIRHVLIHRAGVPAPPPEVMDLDLIDRPDEIVEILAHLPQTWRPGTAGRLPRHHGRVHPGRASPSRHGAGHPYRARRRDLPPARIPMDELRRRAVRRRARRALGVDFHRVVELSQDPRFSTGIIPAGNVVTTADELSRFFQLLLDGGHQRGVEIFEPRTIRRALVEQSYFEIDFTLGLPFRYGMGFMLGDRTFSLYGPDTPYAFGHLGFTNVVGWADPERDVAAALLTSGKPVVYPGLLDLCDVMRQIGLACPKVREGGRIG